MKRYVGRHRIGNGSANGQEWVRRMWESDIQRGFAPNQVVTLEPMSSGDGFTLTVSGMPGTEKPIRLEMP